MTCYVKGLDISAWQTIPAPTIWMAQAHLAGIRFCYLKASEGNSSKSKLYDERYAACRALGIHAGPYHFANPDTLEGDPQREAARCFEVSGPWQSGDLPPALDLESNLHRLPRFDLIQWAKSWLEEAARLFGVRPTFYTYRNFWATELDCSDAFAAYPLWQAEYHNETNPKEPTPGQGPKGMIPEWKIWQWTGKGRLDFHAGDLDLNVFRGSEADLDLWCGCAG